MHKAKSGCGVLAVVVVYQRKLEEVRAWRALQAALAAGPPAGGHDLRLEHVLLYDNSARAQAGPLQTGKHRISYFHDTQNGGTARAYTLAAQMARDKQIEWLLLLDHDTDLPDDFFVHASSTLAAWTGPPAAMLLPWIHDGALPLSPATVSLFGGIRPLSPGDSAKAHRSLTGIASGSIVRSSALMQLCPLPPALWLDFVDHWLCAQLRTRGWPLLIFQARLQHDLSINDVARIEPDRLRSILEGEAAFVGGLPWLARSVHPFRLLWRALRYLVQQPALAPLVLRQALRPLKRRVG